jgi:hypothetical protein
VRNLEAAFDELPEHYREVITLSRIAGLSRAEIAAHMGRSEASVRNLLSRALVVLAEAMAARWRTRDGPRPRRACGTRSHLHLHALDDWPWRFLGEAEMRPLRDHCAAKRVPWSRLVGSDSA